MRYYIVSIIIILSITESEGNGGPIDGSAVYQTGDIVLMNRPNIDLIREDLSIKIEGDHSLVNVEYQLYNNGYGDSEITYGFPVDFIRSELAYELQWQEDYLPEIKFEAGGKGLEIKHQVDLSVNQVRHASYGNVDMRRSWHIVDFTMRKGERTILKVSYKVKNGFEDWSTTKSFFPSFDERRVFYDFSPAKHWGDGGVAMMNVEIDARNLVKNGGSIKIAGMKLENRSGLYTGSFNDFDLKNAENLGITYKNDIQKLSGFIDEHRVPKSLIKSLTTTSQLEGNYKSANMLDSDFGTAWVEGESGDGLGEKIEIVLDNYPLAAIVFINGYTKSVGTYKTNNRVKKIRMDREVVDYRDETKTSIKTVEISLEDLPYQEVSSENLAAMMSVLGDYGDGYQKVRKITLTILEVYKGSKYNDTCISEVLLLGYQ